MNLIFTLKIRLQKEKKEEAQDAESISTTCDLSRLAKCLVKDFVSVVERLSKKFLNATWRQQPEKEKPQLQREAKFDFCFSTSSQSLACL